MNQYRCFKLNMPNKKPRLLLCKDEAVLAVPPWLTCNELFDSVAGPLNFHAVTWPSRATLLSRAYDSVQVACSWVSSHMRRVSDFSRTDTLYSCRVPAVLLPFVALVFTCKVNYATSYAFRKMFQRLN